MTFGDSLSVGSIAGARLCSRWVPVHRPCQRGFCRNGSKRGLWRCGLPNWQSWAVRMAGPPAEMAGKHCRNGRVSVVPITAGNRLSLIGTARSAFPAVVLDPAGPCRASGKTGPNGGSCANTGFSPPAALKWPPRSPESTVHTTPSGTSAGYRPKSAGESEPESCDRVVLIATV